MKKKISRIWAVGLVVILLASLFSFAAPASAGTLYFSDETLPSGTGKVVVSGVNVVDLAVAADGVTMYAAPGSTVASTLYKSTNAGVSWTALTISINADLVAVAPDDADVVVIANSASAAVYVTTSGGALWSSLGTAEDVDGNDATDIWDIDIAAQSSGVRYIATAGTQAANTPVVCFFNLGSSAPDWVDAVGDFNSVYSGTNLTIGAIDNFKAVKFSPNFPSDQVLTAVSEEIGATSTAGYARFHMISFNLKMWDATAGFGSNYPVALETRAASATVNAFTVNNADIALAPDYLGADDTLRVAFVGA